MSGDDARDAQPPTLVCSAGQLRNLLDTDGRTHVVPRADAGQAAAPTQPRAPAAPAAQAAPDPATRIAAATRPSPPVVAPPVGPAPPAPGHRPRHGLRRGRLAIAGHPRLVMCLVAAAAALAGAALGLFAARSTSPGPVTKRVVARGATAPDATAASASEAPARPAPRAPAAPAPAPPAEPTQAAPALPPASAGGETTGEDTAAEALARGELARALEAYRALARQHPTRPVFAAFATLLEARVARTDCKQGTVPCAK